jgi:hypothetical protein
MWLGAWVDPIRGGWRWVDDNSQVDPDAYMDWTGQFPPAATGQCLEFESEYNNHWNSDFCDELNFHICERP